ncbi:hypothetical protein ACVDG3_02725 [Meridianimarinicoccus sp. RP-17]|uniref:hypothetical protein n=1 Tax=Meridianimarinicoccus zhengii TaxID=2056810 RepID=UPI000DADA158|nr:hypothetical protein [Phycocomes zhengii]
MAFGKDHDLHQRRFGRNLGLGLALAAFVAVMFGLTVVKIDRGGINQGFDHVLRPEMLPAEGAQ